MDDLVALRRRLARRAARLHLGGFRPSGDPLATHFGLTPVALPGEPWPSDPGGVALEFICQLNLHQAPHLPPFLEDVALLTFFVGDDEAFIQQQAAPGSWVVRAYPTLEGLRPLTRPQGETHAHWLRRGRGFECRWEAIEDLPSRADPVLADAGLDHDLLDALDPNPVYGSKVGGYPSLLQGELWWQASAAAGEHLAFALQIDSEEKVGLVWVDSGIVYLARDVRAGHGDRWAVACQFL